MTVKTIRHAGNLGPAQTDKDWSRGVWHDCPYGAIKDGELPGIISEFWFDTMPGGAAPTTEGAFGPFAVFTSAATALAVGANGGWNFVPATDNAGAGFRGKATNFKIARGSKKLWYEIMIVDNTVADLRHGFLTGLIGDHALTAISPITAAGAIADVNVVGFRKDEADGDMLDTVYRADTVPAVTVQADAAAIAANVVTKLGMVWNPDIDGTVQDVARTGVGQNNLTYYVNGIPTRTRKQIPAALGTDFPNDVSLSPFFMVLNAANTVALDAVAVHRLRVVQLF